MWTSKNGTTVWPVDNSDLKKQDFSITYMESEICIMMKSGSNREENWQKIGLLAYNCEGKKEIVIKKQDKC